MNKKLTIRECANAVIEIMRSLDYKNSTISAYRNLFDQFIDYCDNAGKDVFDQMTAIEYAGIITGRELTDLAMPDSYDIKYVVLLRSLRLLGEYSQSQTFTPRHSKFFEPFQDNPYWMEIYKVFMDYLKIDCDVDSGKTATGIRNICNSNPAFLQMP